MRNGAPVSSQPKRDPFGLDIHDHNRHHHHSIVVITIFLNSASIVQPHDQNPFQAVHHLQQDRRKIRLNRAMLTFQDQQKVTT